MKRILVYIATVLLFISPVFAAELHKPAPNFTLTDSHGKEVSLEEFRGKTVVLEWFNKGCPFVQKHYRGGAMQSLQSDYSEKEVVWLAINSTNPKHRDFLNEEKTNEVISEWKIKNATLLLDPEGTAGKLYDAKTTPHMFVVNPEGVLVYEGAIDDDSDVYSDPRKAKNYVRGALDDLLVGKEPSTSETKPYGCSVKYRG